MDAADSETSQLSASQRLVQATVSSVVGLGVSVSAHACAYETEIRAEARRQGVNPDVAVAIAQAESSCRPDAIGPDGERGLFQFDEATWQRVAGVPWAMASQPEPNIRAGIAHLAENRERGERDPRDYLAWHNAGRRSWRGLSQRWTVRHPNQIYRAWYRREAR